MLKRIYCSSILITVLITLFVIFFSQVDAQAITVKGAAYQDEGITLVADNTTIKLIANGTTSSVATSSTGYIINGVTAASGTTLIVFIDDASTTGATVTKSSGLDIDDLHIYQNHLIARSDDGSSLTIANMAAYDKNSATFDADIPFDAVDTVNPHTLTVDTGNEFYIWPRSWFYPRFVFQGSATVDVDDVKIAAQGTFYVDWTCTTTNVSGSWTNLGTYFPAGDYTCSPVIFDATSGTENITSGGWPFYNVTFNDGGGGATWELEDDLEVDNDLTITSGILDTNSAESNSINVAGNWSNAGNFVARNGIVTFDGASSITSGGSSFYNLTFSPGAPATYTLEDDLEVDNDLTITGGFLDTHSAESNSINIEGNWTISGTGVFVARNGTVTFDDDQSGTHTITSGGDVFYNLTFSPSASATYTLEDALDVDNDLTITAGILDTKSAESNTINVAGSWTNSGTFIANSGIVTFDGATPQTVTSGDSAFYNLTFSPSASVTYTLEDSLDVDNDLTITAGILDTKSAESNTISVEGSWTNSGTFIARNGRVTFDDDQPNTHTITSGGSAFYGLTFSPGAAAIYTLEDALEVDNTLTITAGILDTHSAESNSITIAGSWTNSGSFTANSGIVTFDGATPQTVTTGGSYWNTMEVANASTNGVTFTDKFTCAKFSCTTPSASLNFKYQQTDEAFVITASGGLNLRGTTGNLISLRRYGGSGSNQWYINPSGGSWTVSYVNVKDSYNSHSTYINPSNSTNSGNNYNWFTQVTSTTSTAPATTTTTTIRPTTTTTTTPATTTTTPATTTTTPATTTTTPTSTTTQPFSCEVVITPSSEAVGFEQTMQFSASTDCDGESVIGIYIWDLDSLIGSTIDDNGLYKASTEEGEDTVIATDIANDNISDIATVTVGLNIEVSPTEVLRSRWVPLLTLMSIKGSETNFELLITSVNYDSTSVLPLPVLVLPPEDIYQIILIMPSWFNSVWDEPGIKVTVTTDSEVAVGSFDIKMLPEILDEEKNLK